MLEIGGGTGANLAHYGPAVESLTITEPEVPMLKRLERRVRAEAPGTMVLRAPAEDLPFEDDTFDVVVSTLVLCGVDDQPRALREIRRVLRPEGRLLFLEHVRSTDPKVAQEARPHELGEPAGGVLRLQPADAGDDQGCRLRRDVPRAHHLAQGAELRTPRHRRDRHVIWRAPQLEPRSSTPDRSFVAGQ